MEFSGRGDPVRSMELLWGTARRTRRGPKQTLALEQVVTAAVELADADGLAGLSMRRVADRLGVATMSLYTYVPAKAELLDLMLDAVHGEREPSDEGTADEAPPAGWRDRLEGRAHADLARYRRHPWTLEVAGARSVLGPNEMDAYEAALEAVSGIGLSGAEMAPVVGLLGAYVRGAAQGVVDAEAAPEATGQSDQEWWAAREPLLAPILVADRFPTIIAVAADGAFDGPRDDTPYLLAEALAHFEFGLQRVLDGVTAFVDHRPAPG